MAQTNGYNYKKLSLRLNYQNQSSGKQNMDGRTGRRWLMSIDHFSFIPALLSIVIITDILSSDGARLSITMDEPKGMSDLDNHFAARTALGRAMRREVGGLASNHVDEKPGVNEKDFLMFYHFENTHRSAAGCAAAI
jgi:hypothetical protein